MATYSRKRRHNSNFNLTPLPPSRERQPLKPASHNKRPSDSSSSASKPPVKKKPHLTQMTIDLGGNPQRTCKECGMEYMPSNSEDAALHKMFHASVVGGVDVPAGFSKGAQRVWEGARRIPWVLGDGAGKAGRARGRTGGWRAELGVDAIFEVGGESDRAARRVAQRVLEIAEKELGAVEMGEEELWGQLVLKKTHPGREVHEEDVEEQKRKEFKPEAKLNQEDNGGLTRDPADADLRCDKHRVYLYIQQNKCVGLCLAERIRRGRAVLPAGSSLYTQPQRRTAIGTGLLPPPPSSPSASAAPTGEEPVTSRLSSTFQPAVLGISRMWVSHEFRGLGVASHLLHAVYESFSRKRVVRVNRDKVAFSQPTDAGTKLAKRWFGKDDGWLVYDSNCV